MNKTNKQHVFEYIQLHENIKIIDTSFIHHCDKPTNTNEFECLLKVHIDDIEYEYNSNKENTKKKAENSSYDKLYKRIQSLNSIVDDTNIKNKSFEYYDEIFIIVDHENINNKKDIQTLEKYIATVRQHHSFVTTDINIIKICSINSNIKDNCDIIVESTRKDATDHYISYLCGKLENKTDKKYQIHVMTSDHFGSCLSDISPNIHHSISVDYFINLFETFFSNK
jgi:hypothetical protein